MFYYIIRYMKTCSLNCLMKFHFFILSLAFLNNDEKIVFLFSSVDVVKTVAKTCTSILDGRRRFLYQ